MLVKTSTFFWIFILFIEPVFDIIATNCVKLANNSPEFCLRCAEGYYSMEENAFSDFPFPINNCLPKNQTSLELLIYVYENNETDLLCGDGSIEYPFSSLIYALDFIHKKSCMHENSKIKIYILGEEIFLLKRSLATAQKYYFRRCAIDLEISPFLCSIKNISGCKGDLEQVFIYLKTNQVIFFVSGVLKLKNIIFDGVDMVLESENPSACYISRIPCCQNFIEEPTNFIGSKNNCTLIPDQIEIPFSRKQSLGLFTSEYHALYHNKSYAPSFPKISIENCRFINIMTIFPTKSSRFSSLIQIFDTAAVILINNVIVSNCVLLGGVLQQNIQDQEYTNLKSQYYDMAPLLNITNLTINKYMEIYWKESTHSIIFVENFLGSINISIAIITNNKDSKIRVFDFNNILLSININNIYLHENEDTSFIYCGYCKLLRIANVSIKIYNSLLPDTNSIISIENSEELLLNQIEFEQVFFINQNNLLPNVIYISNILKKLDILRIYFRKMLSPIVIIESSAINWQGLSVLDLSTDFRFLIVKNSSAIFEKLFISFAEIRNESLFSIQSRKTGPSLVFYLSDAHFSNLIFFKEVKFNRIFEWPISTPSDEALIKNTTISNMSHFTFMLNRRIIFFFSLSFNRISLENIIFSNHSSCMNSLLVLYDAREVRLNNVSYIKNDNLNYYLFVVVCSKCKVFITNINVENASTSLAFFDFEGLALGYYENITFAGVSNILTSIIPSIGNYSFNYGLNEFWDHDACIIKNWFFSSSKHFYYSPSRFLYFLRIKQITVQNISLNIADFLLREPEIHILTSIGSGIITITGLYAKNFYCQQTTPGFTVYQGGIISIFSSNSFLKEDFASQLYLIDVLIENCKYCMNGVFAFLNLRNASIKNISVVNSKNLNVGVLAIYYGLQISIENIWVVNSSALYTGGVNFFSGCRTLIIKNSIFSNVMADHGGTIYLKGIWNITLIDCRSISSKGFINGGVIFSTNSNITLIGGFVIDYQSIKDGGFLSVKYGSLKILNNFLAIGGQAMNGCFLYASYVDEVSLSDISIIKVYGFEKGISLFIEDFSNLNAEHISFIDITSRYGFGNIFLKAQAIPGSFKLKNIYCLRVNMLSSALIYMENGIIYTSNSQISMTDIFVSESCGSIVFFKFSILNNKNLLLLKNITISDFNHDFSLIQNAKATIAENLFYFESTYSILENILLKNVSFFINCLYFIQADISLDFFYFQSQNNDSFQDFKFRLLIYFENCEAVLKNVMILGERKVIMGVIFAESSDFSLNTCLLWKCNSNLFSCIQFKNSRGIISSSTFLNNKGFGSGVINSKSSTLVLENSTFSSNSIINDGERSYLNILPNNLVISGNKKNGKSSISYCYFIDSYSGNTLLLNNSIVLISSTSFTPQSNIFPINNQSTTFLKALYCFDSDIEIIHCDFYNFSSENGGTLRVEHNKNNEIKLFTLLFCTIWDSKSDFGGAFSIFGEMKINFIGNTFLRSKASKTKNGDYGNFGVGIFLCKICEKSSWSLIANQFINNFADNGIPTVFANLKIETCLYPQSEVDKQTLDTNTYLNNSDGLKMTKNLSYLPFQAKFFKTDLTESNIVQFSEIDLKKLIYFKSGQAFNFGFILLDSLGQQFLLDDNSLAQIVYSFKGSLQLLLLSNRFSLSDKGEFLFQNFIINADLNKSFELLLKTDSNLNYIYPQYRDYVYLESLKLSFISNPCIVGELLIDTDFSCFKCPFGKYSLINPMSEYKTTNNTGNQKCLSCPANAFCPGGNVITPKKGFWRYSENSSLMIECLSKFSCLGDEGHLDGNELIHGRCLEHSYGPLCYSCALGYGRFSKKGVCDKCASEIISYIKLTIIILMFLSYSLIQIKLTFQISTSSSIGILLKIIVAHFQQLSLISLVDLGWTPDFKAFFAFQDVFAFLTEDLLPLECFLESFNFNIYTQKVITINLFPIVMSLLVFFFWISFLALTPTTTPYIKVRKLLNVIRVSFLVFIVLFFPEIISKCLGLFTCVKVDNSSFTKLLLYSPEVVCWTDEHKKYLIYGAIPGMISWAGIAPLIIAYFLIKERQKIKILIEQGTDITSIKMTNQLLQSQKVSQPINHSTEFENTITLKFLFKGYSSKYYYWELLMFLKKFLLISIGCISDLFPSNCRGVILLVLIAVLLLVQIRYKPYESLNLNKLEFYSLLTTFLTANMGILMFSYDFKKISFVLLITVICINSAFLLYWAILFFEEMISFRSTAFRILQKILNLQKKAKRIAPESNIPKQKLNFSKSNKREFLD